MTTQETAPKRDIGRADAWVLTSWLVLALAVAVIAFRPGSLPLVALAIAVVPAAGPLLPSSQLPVMKYIATTVAAVNGSLVTFLASLALSASASTGTPISELDGRWLVCVAVAAIVAAVGAGVLVHRSQLREAYERWVGAQQLALLVRTARPHGDFSNSSPHPSCAVASVLTAAVVLVSLRRRRGGRVV